MIASYMRHDYICKIWLLFLYYRWDMITNNCIRLAYDMRHEICSHETWLLLTWNMISVYTKVRYDCIWICLTLVYDMRYDKIDKYDCL